MPTAVIVGAGLAGGRAAETLRQQGFEGRVVLLGAEPERPYERPPLSKDYLWGKREEEEVFLRPAGYYAEQDIDLWLDVHATALDPAAQRLDLADGRALRYDMLLIATGATPRRLNAPGADLDGVLYLRTLRDARALRRRIQSGGRVVVVGAGFIGAEVAASCREAGLEVTMLEALDAPLERALGRAIGLAYAEIHRAHGVDLRLGEGVAALRGHGRVEQVVTASGALIDCDFVVVGVGVSPATGWLDGSGVALGNGVLVDEYCRASAPNVFAAGDVAHWWHPTLGERLRVEHFDHAQHHGVAAARNMLGAGAAYAPVPYFWSEQYDVKLHYVGHASGNDEAVLRGRIGDEAWSVFYLRDGRVRAALAVNRYKDAAAARKIIAAARPVDPAVLADEGSDLRALSKSLDSA